MIYSNAGTRKVKMVAELKNYGTVWFDPGDIANILLLARVERRFILSVDSKEGFFKGTLQNMGYRIPEDFKRAVLPRFHGKSVHARHHGGRKQGWFH